MSEFQSNASPDYKNMIYQKLKPHDSVQSLSESPSPIKQDNLIQYQPLYIVQQ